MSRRFLAPVALAATVAAGGVAGALVGVPAVSGAQESSDPTTDSSPERQHWMRDGGPLASAAEALGMERSELFEALRDGKTIADVASERGVDVNTVIDAIVADVVERTGRPEDEVREHVTRLVEEGGPRRHGHFGRLGARPGIEAAAEALGIEPSELAAELRAGKTIAQVADELGADVDAVVDAMVAEARERIERFVEEGLPDRPDAD